MISIENHIRLKDPQRHKARLVEVLDKGEEIEENKDLSTDLLNSGDNLSETGDKSGYISEDKNKVSINYSDNHISNKCINCSIPSDTRIIHNHPFYYCKEHPKFQNIHLEVIESNLILAKDHKTL